VFDCGDCGGDFVYFDFVCGVEKVGENWFYELPPCFSRRNKLENRQALAEFKKIHFPFSFSPIKTMPYIKIWIHFVWSTKERKPFLTNDIRQKVFKHIRENAIEKDIHIDFINGFTDHVHCLVSLGSEQTIKQIMQLIKGESSHWINKNNLCRDKFEWQNDYFAVSVSESVVDKVRNYIANQEEHHKQKSFADEFDDFLKKAGFQRFPD
jgi:putative transposase